MKITEYNAEKASAKELELLQLKDTPGGDKLHLELDGVGKAGDALCPEIHDTTRPASLVMQFLLLLYRSLLQLRRNYVSLN